MMKKYFAAAALLVTMAACGSAAQDKTLEGTTWKLAQMGSIPATAINQEADFFTLEFNAADTMVAGRTNCNRFFGKYELKGRELSFENLQKAIKAGELDFFIAPSGFFAYVAESAGARHIATRHPQGAKDPSKSVGSVFVVRANDSRFNTLSDLVRVSVAATDSNSFDG